MSSTQHNLPGLPEGFLEFLEETGLPCPPLPLSCIERLEQRDEYFFATDMRPIGMRLDFPEDRDAMLEQWSAPDVVSDADETVETEAQEHPLAEAENVSETETPLVSYVGFGLAGYGLQSRFVVYLADLGRLQLGISLPWGLAWGDPESERAELESAFRLAEACQQHIPARGCLKLLINRRGCVWDLVMDESVIHGEDMSSLLDCLEQQDASDDVISCHQWMRV